MSLSDVNVSLKHQLKHFKTYLRQKTKQNNNSHDEGLFSSCGTGQQVSCAVVAFLDAQASHERPNQRPECEPVKSKNILSSTMDSLRLKNNM